ncbi:MAG: hypothetical protein ACR2NN_12500 [Bryobacteraceae bacterium]
MALISVSGAEELARLSARKFDCDLVTESSLDELIAREFGTSAVIPARAWPFLVTSIVAGLSTQRHLVIAATGSELLAQRFPAALRVCVLATGLDAEAFALRKRRFGRGSIRPGDFDLVLNAAAFTPEQMLHLVEAAVNSKGLLEAGTLSAAAEAQVHFQARLQLAKFGLLPPDRVPVIKREFSHPTEEIFANLLDFYRIGWEYEPRSFPLQWDKDGKVQEAFTPDFYLPEFDLFVELTTMKQALITRKNRKIRLLRSIYPHVNIQVFYQKDLQDLIMKYGLTGKAGA